MSVQKSKCYAIIPAAGRSHRMGCSKLLLPWPSDARPSGVLIEQVLDAWTQSKVTDTLLVLRKGADPRLVELCESFAVEIVFADNPPDMKASIQAGLAYLIENVSPVSTEIFLIAPADLPTLSPQVINLVIDSASEQSEGNQSSIVVPKFGNKTGHPVLFPWSYAEAIFKLPHDVGVNQLLNSNETTEIELDENLRITDIDTPEEYTAALSKWKKSTRG